MEHDCQKNLQALIEKAPLLELEGFENIEWEESTWVITGGRLTKSPATNRSKVSLNFHYASNLGGKPLPLDWANLVKALVILSFRRKNQDLAIHRNFITAASYVAHELVARNLNIFQLTPENLNRACNLIPKHYSEGTTYNLHKAVAELAAHCDANKLYSVFVDYKYSQIKRPESIGGIKQQRLDSAQVLETTSKKLVDPEIYKILGELYQNVPNNHKYRIYVLLLTLLALLGRRFSEISLLPNQHVKRDHEGRAYLEYFPRKMSQGDIFTPLRQLFLPTEVIDIVESVVAELGTSCSTARDTATEMQRVKGADLRFLSHLSDSQSLYKKDLEQLGIASSILCGQSGWLRKNGYTFFNKKQLGAN